MEKKLAKIGKAAKLLGTSANTLRKWKVTGKLLLKSKTKGATR
jgi:putative resolvase